MLKEGAMKRKLFLLVTGIGFLGTLIAGIALSSEKGHEHGTATGTPTEFRVAAVRYEGTVLWLPSTLIVKKGQKVKINLINSVPQDPNVHGFAIDPFNIKVGVTRGKPEVVEFTATKEGLFTIYCHLHPAHIGGQLLVLP